MNKKKLISIVVALAIVLGLSLCNNLLDKLFPEFGVTEGNTIETTGAPQTDAYVPETTEEASAETTEEPTAETTQEALTLDPDGSYTTKEDVALYIHTYGQLPGNFMTKSEAKKLGWTGGGLDKYAPGMCIGGDRFGNYEGLLPDADGRVWYECDIDTLGASARGAKRIVFSNDGLIYYTEDHYESFELLYGEE